MDYPRGPAGRGRGPRRRSLSPRGGRGRSAGVGGDLGRRRVGGGDLGRRHHLGHRAELDLSGHGGQDDGPPAAQAGGAGDVGGDGEGAAGNEDERDDEDEDEAGAARARVLWGDDVGDGRGRRRRAGDGRVAAAERAVLSGLVERARGDPRVAGVARVRVDGAGRAGGRLAGADEDVVAVALGAVEGERVLGLEPCLAVEAWAARG